MLKQEWESDELADLLPYSGKNFARDILFDSSENVSVTDLTYSVLQWLIKRNPPLNKLIRINEAGIIYTVT